MSTVIVPQGEDRYALWSTSEDRILYWDCTDDEVVQILTAEAAAVGRRQALRAIEHAKITGRARFGPRTFAEAVAQHEERHPPLGAGFELEVGAVVESITGPT